MLFGRRKPGYTTTVDANADPEQVVLDLQKAEMAAKKKPKAEVFDINAASETARRLKETGSTFDGAAAKAGEDVIAVVERETDELAAKQAAENASAPAETPAEAAPDTDSAAKPRLPRCGIKAGSMRFHGGTSTGTKRPPCNPCNFSKPARNCASTTSCGRCAPSSCFFCVGGA